MNDSVFLKLSKNARKLIYDHLYDCNLAFFDCRYTFNQSRSSSIQIFFSNQWILMFDGFMEVGFQPLGNVCARTRIHTRTNTTGSKIWMWCILLCNIGNTMPTRNNSFLTPSFLGFLNSWRRSRFTTLFDHSSKWEIK